MESEAQISAATNCFLEGAKHLLDHDFSIEVVVNALISAAITCCYHAGEPPEKLKSALRQAANQVPELYERQDRLGNGRAN